MNLTLTEEFGRALAETEGPIDESAATPFREQLHPLFNQRGAHLILDMSQSKRINSEGIAALVRLTTDAHTRGCRVVLTAPTPFICEVLQVTRLDRFFDVADSRDAAHQLLADSAALSTS
ncbi:MAG: STAS domain-containing protein [Planctomycetales bacterium]|nr:STAS domain-containing protein [Planctomycetales bacterium]